MKKFDGIHFQKTDNNMKPKSTRKFGGILDKKEIERTLKERFPDIDKGEMDLRVKLEVAFQDRHLKAYLAGRDRFRFGVDQAKRPIYFEVEDGRKVIKPINKEDHE